MQNQPDVSLDEIVVHVSRAYELSEEEPRGPSRNRVVSEARSVVGWLNRRLEAGSITDVATYFRRDPSTFSRHVGKLELLAARYAPWCHLQQTTQSLALRHGQQLCGRQWQVPDRYLPAWW